MLHLKKMGIKKCLLMLSSICSQLLLSLHVESEEVVTLTGESVTTESRVHQC